MNRELPSFYCPIDPAVHPRVTQIERRAIAWVDEVGLYQNGTQRAHGLATHSAELACRILPDCPDDMAWLFSAWNYWSFALSDCRGPGASATTIADFTMLVIRALEDPGYRPPGRNRLGAALVELIDRTRRSTTFVQFGRLADGLREWLLAMSWQTTNIERGVLPALDDFAAMRPSVTATRLFAAWIEIGNRVEVDSEVRFTAPVRALTAAAGFVAGCDNDLVGYPASSRRSSRQNMVDVLMYHQHCSRQEAIAEVISIRDRVMTRFLVLRDKVRETASPELLHYLEGLNHYLRGFLDWMNTAPRYSGPRDRHARPVPESAVNLVVTQTTCGACGEPPAIPFMKWWWHL